MKTQEAIQNDILLAKTIQKSILPKNDQFNIHFQSSHPIGGRPSADLFDVVELQGQWRKPIADVVGHGISAAMMTIRRESMRRILQETKIES